MSKPQELKKSGERDGWTESEKEHARWKGRPVPSAAMLQSGRKREEQPRLSAGQIPGICTACLHFTQPGVWDSWLQQCGRKEGTKSNYIMNTSIYISLNTGHGVGWDDSWLQAESEEKGEERLVPAPHEIHRLRTFSSRQAEDSWP